MAPSTIHESVLLWLRDDPSRLSALLHVTGHASWSVPLAVDDSALRMALPAEVTLDLVLLEDATTNTGKWAIAEAQRSIDAAKARRWPLAMALMGNRYGPDGELVVITASAAVARWARTVAMHRSGGTQWGVRPTVLHLGPAEAEMILAKGAPEMAVFAAWVMQKRKGTKAIDVGRRSLAKGATIEDERLRRATLEGILAVLHPSVTEQLRSAIMIDINQLPKNPALERWKADLRAEGEARGEARMLVRILRGRGFVVGDDIEARVIATESVDTLERWATRALTAASIDDVFA
jgi:hypothetical protein